MEYNLNLGAWKSVFAVPTDIIDEYLKLLTDNEIKVLICLLRLMSAGDCSPEKISELSGVEIAVVNEILQKINNGELLEKSKTQPDIAVENIEHKPAPKPRYLRPDAGYIATRMESSKEIYFMMQEAQIVLGRPLSNGDSAILLSLHDNDGLPPDVILMLLQYAVSEGKSNMKYIAKVGESWAKDGVVSIEKAERKISELSKINQIWKHFESLIGIEHRAPTSCEEETVMRWVDIWKFSDDMIKEAYERCVNRNGKYVLKYMDSIIKRWHSQGVLNIEQALAENINRNKTQTGLHGGAKASYNIDEYEKYNILDYIN